MLKGTPATWSLIKSKSKWSSTSGLTLKLLLVPDASPSEVEIVMSVSTMEILTETVLIPAEKAPVTVGIIVPVESARALEPV